jgi:hypothetical protein
MRIGSRVILSAFVVLVAGLLSIGVLPRSAAAASTSAASKANLTLTVRVTNPGPLSLCVGVTCPGLAYVTQFFPLVNNGNGLANFNGTPLLNDMPNAYVISSVGFSFTVNGTTYSGFALPVLPSDGAILPGETAAAANIGWANTTSPPGPGSGRYVFTFTVDGTLNGRTVDLIGKSPTIVMRG